MSKIPFPNPHDADSLNTYLDALAAGKQVTPASDVEATAREFHQLASRAVVSVPKQSIEHERGDMQTATLAAPISNRTRRQMATTEKKPGRSYGWLSAVIVAGLLVSMIGSAWLNREPGNPHDQLAFAPGTPETLEVLTPESAPWIADFDPADCTETSGLLNVEIDYQSMFDVAPQSYDIVGPADLSDAEAAIRQYRAMRSCETLTDAWAYWTEARINEDRRALTDDNLAELAGLQEHYAANYPYQFMVIMNDLAISPEIEAEWAARKDAGFIGQPIPLEAKLNPEWAMELSDGRIAFPATNVYSFDDPAIQAYGFPEENPASTVVMIFAMENGNWKYDDSLQLCLVNCGNGVGNPLDPAEDAWAQSNESRTCSPQPLLPEVIYWDDISQIEYQNRQYTPVGMADPDAAAPASDTIGNWIGCGGLGEVSNESMSFMTPLGVANMNILNTGGAGDPFIAAPYLRQWDSGGGELVSNSLSWNQVAVIDERIRSTFGPLRWEPMIDGSAPNLASVRRMQQGFNPATATELSDGRMTIFAVPTIALEDRGAITYEGNLPLQEVVGVTLQQHDSRWLVDEIVIASSGVILLGESDAWWWDSAFDEPTIPWTQPVSYHDCPSEKVVTIDQETNPAGTRYTLEEYEGLTSERDYEIVGMAAPEDAIAVVTVMREMQACGLRNESIQAWSARFEWENRTTDGRISLGLIDDERLEASLSVSDWLQSELGLTPTDMVVEQETGDLDLDGTESLKPHFLYDPAHAILFADGRIGIIGSIVYYDDLPADSKDSNPPYYAPHMSFFVFQDGEWLLDENLQVCIGECPEFDDIVDLDGEMIATPTPATPWPVEECAYCRPPGS